MSDPKNSGNFAKPRKIANKICQPRKIGFGQTSNPEKDDPCQNFDMCLPWALRFRIIAQYMVKTKFDDAMKILVVRENMAN